MSDLDLLEPPDRGAVKAEALVEGLLGQLVRRDREVLHQAGQIGEAQVNDLDLVVPDQVEDVSGESVTGGASFTIGQTWATLVNSAFARCCWLVLPERW